MPAWAEVIIGISVVIGAVGIIWSKVLKPGARLIAQLEKTYPLLVKLTDVFEDGDGFTVLHEIADQFKANAGSSLKDAINRLEAMVTQAHQAAEQARLANEVAKELAELDRAQVRRVELLVARLTDHVTDMGKADAVVAADLVVAKQLVKGVADDAAAAHARADEIHPSSSPGEAADAASRTPNGDGEDAPV